MANRLAQTALHNPGAPIFAVIGVTETGSAAPKAAAAPESDGHGQEEVHSPSKTATA
jgi:hypothetical protein